MPLILPQIGIENLQFQGSLQEYFTDQTRFACDDWINGIQSAMWILAGSGSGTVDAASPESEQDHPGIIQARSTATAADAGMISLTGPAPTFFLKTGITEFRQLVRVPTLSDGTNRFIAQFGISDATITGDVSNGVYFEYSDNVNSGNWTCCAALASTRTKINSGIPVVAGAWTEIVFRTHSDGNGADFSVNGVAAGSVTSNMPTGVNTGIKPLHFKKSLGTAARSIQSDYVFLGYSFRPGR